jgi:hypothetical protein
MHRALTFALVAIAGSAYLHVAVGAPTSACAVYASSKKVVETIIQEKTLSPSVTTEAALASTVQYLYSKYTAADQGYNTNLYVSDFQNNFYILKNCWARENSIPGSVSDFNVYCQQAGSSQYLLFMRNEAVKGDTRMYIYPLNEAGAMGKALVTRNNTFVLDDQKWHRQTDQTWSEDFTNADGSTGSYWTMTMFDTANMFLANVAAEYTSEEKCKDWCLANSAASSSVAAFETLYSSARNSNSYLTMSGADKIYMLYEALTSSNNGYGAFLWYADENNNYYALEDCYRLGAESSDCIKNPSTRYLAHVMEASTSKSVYTYEPGTNYALSQPVNQSSFQLTSESTYTSATAEGKWLDEKQVTNSKLMLRHYSKLIQDATQSTVARAGAQRFSDEPCTNGCLVNAAAFRASNTAAGSSVDFASVAADTATVISRLEGLTQIFLNTNQGSSEVLFWGSQNGDEFISLQNCYTPDSVVNGVCKLTKEKYIGYIKSVKAFGDAKRRVFAISEAGKVMRPEIQIETVDFSYSSGYSYYTTNLNGWSSEPSKQIAGMKTTYRSYQKAVYSGTVQTGVIGGIRTSREKCYNGCLENSYAIRATRLAAKANLTQWAEINTLEGVAGPVKTLVEAMQQADQGYSMKLYVGIQKKNTEGDYYGIQDCYTRESADIVDTASSKWCMQAGASVKYIAHLRVQKVFGNSMRYYKVWSNGTLGELIGTEDSSLVVNKTPWYEKGQDYGGWMRFSQYGTGALKSTYVLQKLVFAPGANASLQASLTGVIAADKVFPADQSSTCSNVCVTNSYAFPMAYSLYHGALTPYGNDIDANAEVELVKKMVSALEDFDRGYNQGISFLQDCANPNNCNYYGVTDCSAPENAQWEYCVKAGATTKYVITRRNRVLHGDSNYYFNAATVAGNINSVSLGNLTTANYNTQNLMEEFRKREFGHLPGTAVDTTNSPKIFGSAGAFIISVYDAGYATKTGYVAVTMSSRAPCFNKCLRNSFAPKAVRMAAADQTDGGISPARFVGASDWSTITLAVQNVLDVMTTVDYGNNVMLFIGTEDSDFYGVKNCFIAPTLLADTFCKQAVRSGLQYIAYVRNTRYFNDAKRRVYGVRHQNGFALTSGATINMGPNNDVTPMGVTSSDYPTTERSWYKLRAGWTALYAFSSGGLGQTYAHPFYNMAKNRILGVVAADKYGEEACFEPCTRYSYAAPAVRAAVQNGNLDRFAATDSQRTMSDAISAVYTAYDTNNQGNNKMLYFGMEKSGDYYGVKNCRSAATDLDKYCADPVATARLLAHVKNEAAYNDNKTHVFQISDTGVVNLPATVGMSTTGYDPRTHAWYMQAKKADGGWVYQASYGEFPAAVSYSHKIINQSDTNPSTMNNLIGVAGADRYVKEPCRSACLYSSYAMTATLDFVTKDADELKAGSQSKTNKTVAALIKLMWQSFKKADHGDNVQLMYTVDATGDFYAIKNCWLPGNYMDQFCQQAGNKTWTIAMIRNTAVFGNSDIQVFAIDADGKAPTGTMGSTALGSITTAALTANALHHLNFAISDATDFKSADWYKQQSGWGKVYGLKDGQTVGQIYSVPLTVPTSDGTESRIGIVAAIRTEGEECFSGDDQDVPSIRVRVRTLDTVETIAKRYGYSWTELLLMNPRLKNPNDLKPKTYLYNALLYVVREDDTLYSIATKYGISWQELANMNPQIPQIKASLNWREMPSGDPGGFPYYYNLQTKKAQWDKPQEVIEAEKTDLKIYRGQKLAVRPNLEALVCQNKYYSAKATIKS